MKVRYNANLVLEKVNKPTARKMYNAGKEVYICPCKVNPRNNWGIGHFFQKEEGDGFEQNFDRLVSHYEYYNCQYNELGKYAAYYVKEA